MNYVLKASVKARGVWEDHRVVLSEDEGRLVRHMMSFSEVAAKCLIAKLFAGRDFVTIGDVSLVAEHVNLHKSVEPVPTYKVSAPNTHAAMEVWHEFDFPLEAGSRYRVEIEVGE